jgi:hypothetical protein
LVRLYGGRHLSIEHRGANGYPTHRHVNSYVPCQIDIREAGVDLLQLARAERHGDSAQVEGIDPRERLPDFSDIGDGTDHHDPSAFGDGGDCEPGSDVAIGISADGRCKVIDGKLELIVASVFSLSRQPPGGASQAGGREEGEGTVASCQSRAAIAPPVQIPVMVTE